MARTTTSMVGSRTPGMAAVGLGSPLLVASASTEAARSIWDYIQDIVNPPAPAAPPVSLPAAPQSYGTLTVPGAWTPAEMYGQTMVQQNTANEAYKVGSASGFEVGRRLGGDTAPDRASEAYMAVFMTAVVGIGAYMLLVRR